MKRQKGVRLGILGLMLVVGLSFRSFPAKAASLANFDPGYIISDYQMGNYNAMSEGEIQAFLSAKNPCGNRDYNYYVSLSRNPNYRWHFENGHFVCLSEERFGHNDNEIGFQYGETAAHIIWQAAQDYRINPQVIIVLLQKETGLITDPIPNNGDYRKATGYGCPDTAACSSQYYGFRNQVRNAASLFRTVLDGGWTNYPLGNNYIQYNPNAACGGSVVNIRSRATSALYRYTPYQPNAGALAAGYGTASCGAYGNRNFYLYFEDWFGGVTGEGWSGGGVVSEDVTSSEIIEDEYEIKTGLGERTLDVMLASDNDGANVQIWDRNGTGAQEWRVRNNGEGTYTIINVKNGKALDVLAAGTGNGTNVQLYADNGSCAQKWKIVRNDDGTVTFYSACSGRVLDVWLGENRNGQNVQIWGRNGTAAQKWWLMPKREVADGDYTLRPQIGNDMRLDVTGAGNANGTNIQIYERNETVAQEWNLKMGGDGYYRVKNPATGKSLDVYAAGREKETNVQLYEDNETCAQKWQLVRNGDGTYGLYSACSGLALDVWAAGNTNGANVQIWEKNGTVAQKWNLMSRQELMEGDYTLAAGGGGMMVLDLWGAENRNGANVQVYNRNGTGAQKWRIRYIDGFYELENMATGKMIDVAMGGRNNGTNVQIWERNGTAAQRWIAQKNERGNYIFRTEGSGKALDVLNGRMENMSNVQIWDVNGMAAQEWKIERL